MARALGSLPAIDAAFAAARLSYSKVRALTRVACAANEAVLLDMALHATADHLEQICRGIRAADHDQSVARDVETRWVRERAGDHGMVRIEAQLHPDEAAIVWAAIERARAADAVPHADALVQVARSFDDAGTPTRTPEVVVHVREELIGEAAMTATLDDGHRVPAETLRRVACDCVTQAVALDGEGLPIDVGRKRRTVTPALRRALLARDHGCRFPGCAHRAWLDAHHVEHWLHGGETELANLVMLCPFHHRLVHEGGFSIERGDGAFRFLDPRGAVVRGWQELLPPSCVPAETPVDHESLIPRWDGTMPDISACVAAGLAGTLARTLPGLELQS